MKNKKVFISIAVCCVTVLIGCFFIRTQSTGIALGSVTVTENDRPAEWQNIITKEINTYQIKLIVDNEEIKLKKAGIFIDEDMNIMIPAYIFSDAFSCAFNQ